ncbi:PEP-CTERM system histidine kinase PrsK [Porphyrobacter algicida]|uniref:histidine kinase n=1 Tax=Qipengyuania algicida TaxID=1836209 RepID=A0A845AID4_9SPHN|nr:XrtA/PEP-CTERM system histidine kinase PrsK [Qipengyuania algicida]MXP28595.1 PEP-CTERM system histidine kinase PrsK [Qipengyuania algicida]
MAQLLTLLLFGAGAVVCALSAIAVAKMGDSQRSDRFAGITALLVSGVWCLLVITLPPSSSLTQFYEILRNLAWIFVLFRLFANDGRDESLALVRPVAVALGLVEFLQFFLIAIASAEPQPVAAVVQMMALFRILVAVGALLLVHNLYGGAATSSRRLLAWNSAALALFWLFELNLYTVAYLSGKTTVQLGALRAAVVAVSAAMFAFGYLQKSAGLRFKPSRAMTFSTLSIALTGFYFLAMVALSDRVARASGDLAHVTQVGILLLAAIIVALWLPSPRLRGSLRLLALKHLFKHRYDYRNEWIRFTNTMANAASDTASLQQRAIQSLADITDSGAGLLLAPDETGSLTLAERWRWDAIDVPAPAMPSALARIFEGEGLILDFGEVRAGIEHHGELQHIPEWLVADPQIWSAVPLLHSERLMGVIVLARPAAPRRLDWEDFDLLAISGQQLASYLAENASHEALQEAARFDEFNRRMAFVMHDIKNLSSQMGLLARNAEKHAENPEFRKDMVVTLRNSTDKLDGLVRRLGRYGTPRGERRQAIELKRMARDIRLRFAETHPVEIQSNGECVVVGDAECLDQAISHLVQNAIDASPEGHQVLMEIGSTGLRGEISVIDTGKGMSAQFIRTELFRPFQSTKDNGFGIGACEARELVHAMGGRLHVQSREGLGSRFTVSLPLAEAARLIERQHGTDDVDERAA